MIGLKFNKLTILEYSHRLLSKDYYKCTCDCGNIITSSYFNLKYGNTKSCGCIRKTRSGLSKTVEYDAWLSMIDRCVNTENKRFEDYGGRGISVCNEWLNDFERFLSDIGKRPSKLYSLDRIDNNLNYCKDNCKWSTAKEQANNRRNNITMTYNNETLNIEQWSEKLNISTTCIRKRIRSGWSIEKILTTTLATNKQRFK